MSQKTDLSAWDAAVASWRAMRRQRPLGIYYKYPEVALPADLTIPPKRYAVRDYPLAFWTLDSVARGA